MLIGEDWGRPASCAIATATHLSNLQTMEDECAHSRGETTVLLTSDPPPEKKRKSALDDIFGNVFVTTVVPTKSVCQIVESELANYKVKETCRWPVIHCCGGKQMSSNTPFC